MPKAAVNQVLQDWRKRDIQKPRAILPVAETERILRKIRRHACKAAGVKSCNCWALVPAVSAMSGQSAIIGVDESETIEYVGPAFEPDDSTLDPCFDCRTPKVSKVEFSIVVFGENSHVKEAGGPLIDPKVFSRPMSPTNLYRIVAAAFVEGWISLSLARTILDQAMTLDATSHVVRRFLKRLRSRASFVNTGIIKGEPASVFDEIDAAKAEIQEDMLIAGRRKVANLRQLDQELRDWILSAELPNNLSQRSESHCAVG